MLAPWRGGALASAVKDRAWQIVSVLVAVAVVWFFSANKNADEEPAPAPQPRASSTYSSNLEFHGYSCTQDCSGHEAGYDWAERRDITDEDDCTGNSESFIEGCK